MATLIEAEKVKLSCSCQRLKPISNLYYCKYCKPFALKCKECVLHEVDQKYFCATCFDNKTHKEAKGFSFRCQSCFSCPCCKHTLMIRASSGRAAAAAAAAAAASSGVSPPTGAAHVTPQPTVSQPSPTLSTGPSTPTHTETGTPAAPASTPQQSQKVFYLMCGFCRWTTRDVGMADVLTITGSWHAPENPNDARVSELLEAYKVVAAREKSEKDRKKYALQKRRTFHMSSSSPSMSTASGSTVGGGNVSAMSSDKYGILGPANRRIKAATAAGQSAAGQEPYASQTIEVQLKSLLHPPSTVDQFDPLPEEYFTKPISINSLTSINQRHANPELQPIKTVELVPLNKPYVTKESKRCNGCEHNVLKPESNITSIKFKLHQMAIFMVPEVRIMTIPQWKLDEPNEVILTVTNRSEIDMNVSFVPLEGGEGDPARNLSGFVPNADVSFSASEDTEVLIDRQDNAKAQSAALKPSDSSTSGLVCFRRDNKIGIVCKVTPRSAKMSPAEKVPHVRAVFGLKHTLDPKASSETSMSTSGAPQPPVQNVAKSPVLQKVFIDFGPLRAEDGLRVIQRPKYVDDCLNNAASSPTATSTKTTTTGTTPTPTK